MGIPLSIDNIIEILMLPYSSSSEGDTHIKKRLPVRVRAGSENTVLREHVLLRCGTSEDMRARTP